MAAERCRSAAAKSPRQKVVTPSTYSPSTRAVRSRRPATTSSRPRSSARGKRHVTRACNARPRSTDGLGLVPEPAVQSQCTRVAALDVRSPVAEPGDERYPDRRQQSQLDRVAGLTGVRPVEQPQRLAQQRDARVEGEHLVRVPGRPLVRVEGAWGQARVGEVDREAGAHRAEIVRVLRLEGLRDAGCSLRRRTGLMDASATSRPRSWLKSKTGPRAADTVAPEFVQVVDPSSFRPVAAARTGSGGLVSDGSRHLDQAAGSGREAIQTCGDHRLHRGRQRDRSSACAAESCSNGLDDEERVARCRPL